MRLGENLMRLGLQPTFTDFEDRPPSPKNFNIIINIVKVCFL